MRSLDLRANTSAAFAIAIAAIGAQQVRSCPVLMPWFSVAVRAFAVACNETHSGGERGRSRGSASDRHRISTLMGTVQGVRQFPRDVRYRSILGLFSGIAPRGRFCRSDLVTNVRVEEACSETDRLLRVLLRNYALPGSAPAGPGSSVKGGRDWRKQQPYAKRDHDAARNALLLRHKGTAVRQPVAECA